MSFLMSPLIYSLLFPSCPSAVFRAIMTIWIDTIQAFLRWTRSHICQEILEAVTPSVTDCDAPAAIKHIVHLVGIIAPDFHTHPRAIGWRNINVVLGLAVGRSKFASDFSIVASARKGTARLQSVTSNPASCAAITNAFPKDIVTLPCVRTDNTPSAKPSSSKVHKLLETFGVFQASARSRNAFSQVASIDPFDSAACTL